MLFPLLTLGHGMKPARKDGLETKRRLVDTAERLFAEQGVEQVTLVDVSREAGQKNRNAAQYHFGDRVGLINAVLDKHSDMITQRRQLLRTPTTRDVRCFWRRAEKHRLLLGADS